ncbi:MAG TPA: hypothetical protein VGO78_08605 [Acidimicrobiales bacterium]|nr:hypothetical protein [Acidimicrobiales bacterium]
MGLFDSDRHGSPTNDPDRWTPTVDLATARLVVFALANSPRAGEDQVRLAIAKLGRLSDRPDDPLEIAFQLGDDPDVVHRPWIWLRAVVLAAAADRDDHLVAAGLFWAFLWTTNFVPRGNPRSFVELGLDPIPLGLAVDILAIGIASLTRLPADFVIVGDETAVVHAHALFDQASRMIAA